MTTTIEKNISSENENINIENSVKIIFKNKIEKIISLHINNIQVSEFMTRSQSINEEHVQKLMDAIQEEGYLPGEEVWVNAITGTDGKILHYRLIAGRHRLEACLRLGIEEIPALIFRDLTAMEECIADRVSNKKASRHRKVSYLEEAMHCLYLHNKGWGLRQIAHAKNISKSAVSRKIQIVQLPKSVLDISVTVPSGTPMSEIKIPESHLESICKLKEEAHQMMVCKKILGEDTDNDTKTEERAEKKIIPASEIKKMVRELKLTEAQGKLAAEAVKYIRDEKIYVTSISVEAKDEVNIAETIEEDTWKLLIENIFEEQSEKREKGLRYSITPMWIRHCNVSSGLNLSAFCLLLEIIGNDLRFRPDKKDYFFITSGECYDTTEQYLAAIIGVKEQTLIKKTLPSISEYVDYRKPGEVLKFKVKWNRLFEFYKKNANKIPFQDGGLAGIPEGYTGKIHPTPYHCLYIENGQVKKTAAADKTEGPDLFQNTTPEHTPVMPVEPEIKDRLEVEPEVKAQPVAEIKAESELNPEVIPAQQTAKQTEEETQDIADTACHSQEQNTSPAPEVEREEITEEARETSRILKDAGMGDKQAVFCVTKENIETTLNVIKYIHEMTPAEKEKINNIPGFIYKAVRDGFIPPKDFVSYREAQEKAEKHMTLKNVAAAVRMEFEAGKKVFLCPKEGVFYPILTMADMIFTYRNKHGKVVGGSFADWPRVDFFGIQQRRE